jgi:hypothetical protein
VSAACSPPECLRTEIRTLFLPSHSSWSRRKCQCGRIFREIVATKNSTILIHNIFLILVGTTRSPGRNRQVNWKTSPTSGVFSRCHCVVSSLPPVFKCSKSRIASPSPQVREGRAVTRRPVMQRVWPEAITLANRASRRTFAPLAPVAVRSSSVRWSHAFAEQGSNDFGQKRQLWPNANPSRPSPLAPRPCTQATSLANRPSGKLSLLLA